MLKMITLILIFDGEESNLKITLDSLKKKFFSLSKSNLDIVKKIIFIDQKGNANRIIKENIRNFNIHYIDASRVNMACASNMAIEYLDSEFFIFVKSGDEFSSNALSRMLSAYKTSKKDISFVIPNLCYFSKEKNRYIKHFAEKYIEYIDLNSDDYGFCVPVSIEGILFKNVFNRGIKFDESLPYAYGSKFLFELIQRNSNIRRVKSVNFTSRNSIDSHRTATQTALDENWYWSILDNFFLKLIADEVCNIPIWFQYVVIYHLKFHFRLNLNNGNKQAIAGNRIDELIKKYGLILKKIDHNVILNNHELFKLNESLRDLFLRLRSIDPALPADLLFDSNLLERNHKLYISYQGIPVHNISKTSVLLEILDFKNEFFIIEGSIDNYIGFNKNKLSVFLNEKEILLSETYRYAHTKYFGKSFQKRFTFKVEVHKDLFSQKRNSIRFEISLPNGTKIQPGLVTKKYTAKLTSQLRYSYWSAKGLIFFLNKKEKSIEVFNFSLLEFAKKEIFYNLQYFISRKFRLKVFLLRLIYWLSYPYMKKRRIWITYDKIYKGGDCGEYFYRYASSRHDNGVKCYYVIDKNTRDYIRLRDEGYSPLKWGTLKQKITFLYSEVVFNTHAGIISFNSFSNDDFLFLQNIAKFDVACIQHGLSVQRLAFNGNRVFNNTKRYYFASEVEVQNFSHRIYGYEDKNIFRVTGIPRYDGLKNRRKKKILITPTWRNYISLASSLDGQRSYNSDFKKTNYFKIYNRLISDERLIEVAEKNGYELIYLIHPALKSQKSDFDTNKNIAILTATEIDYEEILCESSLMVTDYSGVQFDFAYMRKPIIYYHPQELPPHYGETNFTYKDNGFGEICIDHENLIEKICEYIENDCLVKDFYRERQDAFFKFNDSNSSKRIYDDMLDYKNSLN